MFVHPDIAALRGDPAAQRRVKARMSSAHSAWLEQKQVLRVRRAIAQFGAGQAMERCGALSSLLEDADLAAAFVDPWLMETMSALRSEPLGEVPHRYRYSPGLSSIQLLQSGRASINLVAYERVPAAAGFDPQSALFQDRESYETVLAGSAAGFSQTWQSCEGQTAAVESSQAHWRKGDRIVLKGIHETRQITTVETVFVVLQLTRTPEAPEPTRELRISDGALLRRTSGNKGASERLMAVSVLGAMQHRPALAVMAKVARDLAEDDDVRWESVRQLLALDPAKGMALLRELRLRTSDPLMSPAQMLWNSLTAARPELAQLEQEPA